MSDLSGLLADEAVRQQPATTPPFDTVLRRVRRRRLSQAAGATLAVVAVAGAAVFAVSMMWPGRAQRAAAPVPPPMATFSVPGLQFEYPAAWTSYEYEAPDSYGSVGAILSAILSTNFVADPCTTRDDATGTTITCSGPDADLSPGGVLVTWTGYSGTPGFDSQRFFDAAPGDPSTIGGRPAKSLDEPASGTCLGGGGERQIRTTVLVGDDQPVYRMQACLAEPTALAEEQVQGMLDSVRFR